VNVTIVLYDLEDALTFDENRRLSIGRNIILDIKVTFKMKFILNIIYGFLVIYSPVHLCD